MQKTMQTGETANMQEIPHGDTASERLSNLRDIIEQTKANRPASNVQGEYVNNHIHTTYSFSPYTPSSAAYHAWLAGLTTAGIMDHDSVSGAEEFIHAGNILGIATTVGFECRCKMADTPFANLRLNNPDQTGIAYVTCHGIPHQNLEKANQFLSPYREQRNHRNRAMLMRMNALVGDDALRLDFEKDILPLSLAAEGGGVTERHLLYALALRMIAVYGKGEMIRKLLKNRLHMPLDQKADAALLDTENPFYAYKLLGILKSGLVEKFYIDADEECPHVTEFTAFATSIGAIPAYAYLGDVGASVTGDKKAQVFEDAFIEDLAPWLKENGFYSITYMPTRNTHAQLQRVIALCEAHGLFQISGEDINSPMQSFVCSALEKPEYQHLVQSTWALIGHEKAATEHVENGMFQENAEKNWPDLQQRINHFAAIGRAN